MMKKVLILSTPVGALSSGIGGGVELTIYNLIQEMQGRGHIIKVIAPKGSFLTMLILLKLRETYILLLKLKAVKPL